MSIARGTPVRMDGPCHCPDRKDCFHRRCIVKRVFRDGGVWAQNQYGFCSRIVPSRVLTY